MERQKKVAIFNDLSGFGRCSISVMLPILSVMGHQGVAIPTAILSMHTEFPHYYMRDFTKDLPAYLQSFTQEKITFDAICTGFLGSEQQADLLIDWLKQANTGTMIIVDPVMGDHGHCYPTIDAAIVQKMKTIIPYAQVVLPNLTELCLLCDEDYPSQRPSAAFLCRCCEQLCAQGVRQVVVTGMEEGEQMCTFIYEQGKYTEVYNPKVGIGRPGSGDVFAAVVSGALLQGKSLKESVTMAAMFVKESMELTLQQQTPHAYGLCFEPLLHTLWEKLN